MAGLELTSSNGAICNSHLVFAAYTVDYPEQVLVAGVKTGECPVCPIPYSQIGNLSLVLEPCDMDLVLEAFEVLCYSDHCHFTKACQTVGTKPIQYPSGSSCPLSTSFGPLHPTFCTSYTRAISSISSDD